MCSIYIVTPFINVAVSSSTGTAEAYQTNPHIVQLLSESRLSAVAASPDSVADSLACADPVVVANKPVDSIPVTLCYAPAAIVSRKGPWPASPFKNEKLPKKARRFLAKKAATEAGAASECLDFCVLLFFYERMAEKEGGLLADWVKGGGRGKLGKGVKKEMRRAVEGEE